MSIYNLLQPLRDDLTPSSNLTSGGCFFPHLDIFQLDIMRPRPRCLYLETDAAKCAPVFWGHRPSFGHATVVIIGNTRVSDVEKNPPRGGAVMRSDDVKASRRGDVNGAGEPEAGDAMGRLEFHPDVLGQSFFADQKRVDGVPECVPRVVTVVIVRERSRTRRPLFSIRTIKRKCFR